MEVWNERQAQSNTKAPVFLGLGFLRRKKNSAEPGTEQLSSGGSAGHVSDPGSRAQLSNGGSKASVHSARGSKSKLSASSKHSLVGSRSKLSTTSKSKLSASSKGKLKEQEQHSMVTINAAADRLAAEEEEGMLKENTVSSGMHVVLQT